jgi:quaternary ammonium compound-resistance protein SugE
MNWIYLFAAGFMEIGWVMSLKFSQGFTKLIPMVFYAIFGFLGAYFFSHSLKTLPVSLAYSIWAGIAVIGTSLADVFFLKHEISPVKILFILLILIGIVGLKFSARPA